MVLVLKIYRIRIPRLCIYTIYYDSIFTISPPRNSSNLILLVLYDFYLELYALLKNVYRVHTDRGIVITHTPFPYKHNHRE